MHQYHCVIQSLLPTDAGVIYQRLASTKFFTLIDQEDERPNKIFGGIKIKFYLLIALQLVLSGILKWCRLIQFKTK